MSKYTSMTSSDELDDALVARQPSEPLLISHALGQPCRKRLLSLANTLSTVCLLTCFALSISVVTPQTSLAWLLGFENQLLIVGSFIGVMSLCISNIASSALLAIEARFGQSTLQNYDAIRTGSMYSAHISIYVRAVLLLLLLIPFGLSIGYKRAIGGTTFTVVDHRLPNARYGVDYPDMGAYENLATASYIWLNAFSGSLATAIAEFNDNGPDVGIDAAIPYGYNILLLSNSSAAVLDLPKRDYLHSIRRRLRYNETWEVSASINAIISQLDSDLETKRNSDDYYRGLFSGGQALQSYDRGESGNAFGLLQLFRLRDGARGCLLGLYPETNTAPPGFAIYTNPSGRDAESFRKHALLFNVQRRRCSAKWRITSTSVQLLSGKCDINNSAIIDSTHGILAKHDADPFPLDVLPNLHHILAPLGDALQGDENLPDWKYPAYAISVALNYWARAIYTATPVSKEGWNVTDTDYAPLNERITSFRSSLRANWFLYLILSVEPVLGLLGVGIVVALYKSPISHDFGLITVLAGVRRDTLGVLHGAAFSGKVKKPLWLQIQGKKRTGYSSPQPTQLDVPRNNDKMMARKSNHVYVEYKLYSEKPEKSRFTIRKDQIYT